MNRGDIRAKVWGVFVYDYDVKNTTAGLAFESSSSRVRMCIGHAIQMPIEGIMRHRFAPSLNTEMFYAVRGYRRETK